MHDGAVWAVAKVKLRVLDVVEVDVEQKVKLRVLDVVEVDVEQRVVFMFIQNRQLILILMTPKICCLTMKKKKKMDDEYELHLPQQSSGRTRTGDIKQ